MSRKVSAQKFVFRFRLLLFDWISFLSKHQWRRNSVIIIRCGKSISVFKIGVLLEKIAGAAHLFHFLTVIRGIVLLVPQFLKIIHITGFFPLIQSILEYKRRRYLESIREKTLCFLVLVIVYVAWLYRSHFLRFALFWSCWIRANWSTILVMVDPIFE